MIDRFFGFGSRGKRDLKSSPANSEPQTIDHEESNQDLTWQGAFEKTTPRDRRNPIVAMGLVGSFPEETESLLDKILPETQEEPISEASFQLARLTQLLSIIDTTVSDPYLLELLSLGESSQTDKYFQGIELSFKYVLSAFNKAESVKNYGSRERGEFETAFNQVYKSLKTILEKFDQVKQAGVDSTVESVKKIESQLLTTIFPVVMVEAKEADIGFSEPLHVKIGKLISPDQLTELDLPKYVQDWNEEIEVTWRLAKLETRIHGSVFEKLVPELRSALSFEGFLETVPLIEKLHGSEDVFFGAALVTLLKSRETHILTRTFYNLEEQLEKTVPNKKASESLTELLTFNQEFDQEDARQNLFNIILRSYQSLNENPFVLGVLASPITQAQEGESYYSPENINWPVEKELLDGQEFCPLVDHRFNLAHEGGEIYYWKDPAHTSLGQREVPPGMARIVEGGFGIIKCVGYLIFYCAQTTVTPYGTYVAGNLYRAPSHNGYESFSDDHGLKIGDKVKRQFRDGEPVIELGPYQLVRAATKEEKQLLDSLHGEISQSSQSQYDTVSEETIRNLTNLGELYEKED